MRNPKPKKSTTNAKLYKRAKYKQRKLQSKPWKILDGWVDGIMNEWMNGCWTPARKLRSLTPWEREDVSEPMLSQRGKPADGARKKLVSRGVQPMRTQAWIGHRGGATT